MNEDIRIVAIGGGHGLSGMLRGLKKLTKNITAIVTVADDGGGSGVLRQELRMLPPGDIRNCITALSNTERTMEQLFTYRFRDGSLAGQSFGNLFLAAMNGICPSFDEAVKRTGEVLAITGKVLPVTNCDVMLEAEFESGRRVLGESKIFYAKKLNACRIRRVRLVPEHPPALQESLDAIKQAQLILIGPGSLYTSILPNFLVDGIREAVAESKAPKFFIMNIMTQDGETEGYSGFDHVEAVLRHAPRTIDVCIANNAPIDEEVLARYRLDGVEPIILRKEKIEAAGIRVMEYPLVANTEYIRHSSSKLAHAIAEVYDTICR